MSIRSTLRWARIGMVSTLILGMSLNNAGAWGWLRCRGGNARPATCCVPAVVTECVPVCCDGGIVSTEVVGECAPTAAEPCCPSVSEPTEGCCDGSPVVGEETAPTPMEATPGTEMTRPADPAPTPATPTPAEPAPMGEPATPASSSEPAPMEPPPQPETPAPAATPPQAEAEATDPLLGDPGLTSDPDSSTAPSEELVPPADDVAPALPTDDATPAEPASDPAADAPASDATTPDAATPDGLDSFDFGDTPAADGAAADGAAADGTAPAESAAPADDPAPPTETPADEKDADDLLNGLGTAPQSRGAHRLISVRNQHLPQRFWSDSSGQFHTTGKLVDIGAGAIRLLKDNGRFTTVAINKLSRIDRAYIRAVETNLSNPMAVAATK